MNLTVNVRIFFRNELIFDFSRLRTTISKILPSRKIVLIRHKQGDPAITLVTSREFSYFIGHFLLLLRINTILRLGRIFDIQLEKYMFTQFSQKIFEF
jgi:hypothetical protein